MARLFLTNSMNIYFYHIFYEKATISEKMPDNIGKS